MLTFGRTAFGLCWVERKCFGLLWNCVSVGFTGITLTSNTFLCVFRISPLCKMRHGYSTFCFYAKGRCNPNCSFSGKCQGLVGHLSVALTENQDLRRL